MLDERSSIEFWREFLPGCLAEQRSQHQVHPPEDHLANQHGEEEGHRGLLPLDFDVAKRTFVLRLIEEGLDLPSEPVEVGDLVHGELIPVRGDTRSNWCTGFFMGDEDRVVRPKGEFEHRKGCEQVYIARVFWGDPGKDCSKSVYPMKIYLSV